MFVLVPLNMREFASIEGAPLPKVFLKVFMVERIEFMS